MHTIFLVFHYSGYCSLTTSLSFFIKLRFEGSVHKCASVLESMFVVDNEYLSTTCVLILIDECREEWKIHSLIRSR